MVIFTVTSNDSGVWMDIFKDWARRALPDTVIEELDESNVALKWRGPQTYFCAVYEKVGALNEMAKWRALQTRLEM